jgi:WD40 repeat protein
LRNAELWIWDVKFGKCEKKLGWHEGYEAVVDVAEDGSVVSGSQDTTLRIWDKTMENVPLVTHQHYHYVRCRAWSWDGGLVATGSDDWTIRLWNSSSGDCLKVLERHSRNVSCVEFSKDNRWLASASWDKTVIVWDVATYKSRHVLSGHTAGVSLGRWSDNARKLASASVERIWNVDSGECIQSLKDVQARAKSLIWASEMILCSGSEDGTNRCWDGDSGTCTRALVGHTSCVLSLTAANHVVRGLLLLSGSHDKAIRVWSLTTGACDLLIEGHDHGVSEVVWSKDTSRIL